MQIFHTAALQKKGSIPIDIHVVLYSIVLPRAWSAGQHLQLYHKLHLSVVPCSKTIPLPYIYILVQCSTLTQQQGAALERLSH